MHVAVTEVRSGLLMRIKKTPSRGRGRKDRNVSWCAGWGYFLTPTCFAPASGAERGCRERRVAADAHAGSVNAETGSVRSDVPCISNIF